MRKPKDSATSELELAFERRLPQLLELADASYEEAIAEVDRYLEQLDEDSTSG